MFKQIDTTVPVTAGLIVGDINGDGKADFLLPSSDGTHVTVLLGNGDGTTRQGGVLTVSGGISHLAVGDINGDGKLDLAIANGSENGVTMALGNGDGTFQAQGPSLNIAATALAIGDLNGDGRADLVTGSTAEPNGSMSDAVEVRLQQTDGSYSLASSIHPYKFFSGTSNYSFAIGDVTGDGHADIVLRGYSDSVPVTLAGNGNGQFSFGTPNGSFDQPGTVSIGNFDQKNSLDVLHFTSTPVYFGSPAIPRLEIELSDAKGSYFATPVYEATQINGFAVAGDVNGDGRSDVIFQRAGHDTLQVLLNQSVPDSSQATVSLSVSDDASIVMNISDPDGLRTGEIYTNRTLSTGQTDTFEVNGFANSDLETSTKSTVYFYPNDFSSDYNYVAYLVDQNLNISTAQSASIHVSSAYFQYGDPTSLRATAVDDLLIGVYSTSGKSNIALYDTTSHDEVIIQQNSAVYFNGAAGEGRLTVTSPGGTDALFHIQQLDFLDGVLTFNPADSAAVVARLYEGALGRAPDSIGLSHFAATLNHGTDLHDVARALTSSAEFQAGEGSLDPSSFVQAVYQNLLHRAADANDVAYWSGQLTAGGSRADVIASIAQSSEAFTVSQASLTQSNGIFALDEHAAQVARLYDTAFGRDPDRAGLETWRGFLDQGGPGHTLADVANAFAGSPEFATRYGQSTTDAYVTALYQNTLHRAPDDAGRSHWDAVLNSGAETRAQVALDFSESAEHQALLAPHIQDGIHLI